MFRPVGGAVAANMMPVQCNDLLQSEIATLLDIMQE
jgi:hypothetical protein